MVEIQKMSATQTSADQTPLEGETKEQHLLAYLRDEAADGELYFKSKFIADDVGLSPKEIGALMVKLRENATDLIIEKWSYTSATTWRVQAV
jgi:tRNA G26 N,N-dimethylase Trm1